MTLDDYWNILARLERDLLVYQRSEGVEVDAAKHLRLAVFNLREFVIRYGGGDKQ